MVKVVENIARRQIIQREKSASSHISVVAHYDDITLIDKDDKLIRIFSCEGIDFWTKPAAILERLKKQRNIFFKELPPTIGLYYWILRRREGGYPEGNFEAGTFPDTVNQKYQQYIKSKELFHNHLYLALIIKPPENRVGQIGAQLRQLWNKTENNARQKFLIKAKDELELHSERLQGALSEYGIKPLGIWQNADVTYSEALSFMGELINLQPFPVMRSTVSAATLLTRNRLFFQHQKGLITLKSPDDKKRFAAILSVKGYCDKTFPGMLDEIISLPIEFHLTQSFRFYQREFAKRNIRVQQQDFAQAKDESISQAIELSDTLDEVASGRVGYGLHHFSACLFADSEKELNESIKTFMSACDKVSLTIVKEDILCELNYWAQLPGQFDYIARGAQINTLNLASFYSLHNYSRGKYNNNHWGPCVTVLETLAGSPYYFNFHYRDVGNTLVYGCMGSGKTTLIGFLILQSLKFGGRRIIFDKDNGLEIMIRACGGIYEHIQPGIPTGFNPCQLEDTPENHQFLFELFKKILTIHGEMLNDTDISQIKIVLQGIVALPKRDRQFCHIAALFGAKRKGSLRARFDEWHSDGLYSWIFDNAHDVLNLDSMIIGFDIGEILDRSDCKTPVLMYLLHRSRIALRGMRGGIVIDEGWKALDDPFFKVVIDDEARTPRKKNNFLCLMTQSAKDTVHSSVNKTLTESAACKIFFPNPVATRDVYIEQLGLSETEFELIRTLDDGSRFVLLQFGRGKESVIVRVNLHGLPDEVAVISGREDTVKLMREIIKDQESEDPNVWLPIFHNRRNSP
jgi:type IV secretion system protein VirB4